jgi:hypothetical protein
MRVKRKHVLLATGLVVLALAVGYAISNWLGSSRFGKVAIPIGNGATVYVVHESWGLHSDEISVTLNPDGCVPPNPATDYIDTYGDGHSLVYSPAPNGLVLYTESGSLTIQEPAVPWSGVACRFRPGSPRPRY